MGIYVFNRDFLFESLIYDAGDPSSSHDFGRNLLPAMVRDRRVLSHAFQDYWRDVGTVDSYWQANMDLLDDGGLHLRDERWPIWTHQPARPPARLTRDGSARHSIVAGGAAVAGEVEHSLLFAGTVVGKGSSVTGSLLLPNALVGENCRLRNVIVDSGCEIPDGTTIGEDSIDDAVAYDVSPGGIVLVTAQRLQRRGGDALERGVRSKAAA
jgi:glucose-1-phosphate adenylyltransferase